MEEEEIIEIDFITGYEIVDGVLISPCCGGDLDPDVMRCPKCFENC